MRFASRLFALALLLLGCTPPPTQPLPAGVRAVPGLTLRRIAAGRDALARGDRYWPGFGATPPPEVLVFDERGQWLLGDDGDELAGYTPTGQSFANARVYYAEPSIFLTSHTLRYRPRAFPIGQIAHRARHVDGQVQLTPMFLVESLEALHARGVNIWSEQWLAVLIHEAFHVFQERAMGVRLTLGEPATTVPDRTLLEAFVREEPAYRALLAKEDAFLKNEPPSTPEAARATLRAWLALRTARIAAMAATFTEKKHPRETLDAIDGAYTFTEGTARYVELFYLSDLEGLADPRLRADPLAVQYAPDGYKPELFFRDSSAEFGIHYFYELGDRLCRLLDLARPGWKLQILKRPRLLIGEIEALP